MGKVDWGHRLSSSFSAGLLFAAVSAVAAMSAGCAAGVASNFDVALWQGQRLDSGAVVRLGDLPGPRVVANVYSPTCQPCIEELPAINSLYRRLRKSGIGLVLLVDGRPALHFADGGDRKALRARLLADVSRFRIEAPVLIMGPEFRVAPRDGLISGNPETLIFDTRPLRLRYNFIGPISSARSEADLEADPRFQFVLKQI